MMNRVEAYAPQALCKLLERMRHEICWNYYRVGGAEIESFFGGPGSRSRIALKEVLHDLDKAFAQLCHGRELAYIHAGQSFGQAGFIAGRQSPVCEIVGEAFPDEVMFLQSPKTVLEDGAFRTFPESIEKLPERAGFQPRDAQKMRRSVEIKRFHRGTRQVGRDCAGRHTFTAMVVSLFKASCSWHARSHCFNRSRSSSGGLSLNWAAVFLHRGRTNMLRPRPFTAWNACSSVASSPK